MKLIVDGKRVNPDFPTRIWQVFTVNCAELAENQFVREWAYSELVGAQVDFSAGPHPRTIALELMCEWRHQSAQVKSCADSR